MLQGYFPFLELACQYICCEFKFYQLERLIVLFSSKKDPHELVNTFIFS